MQKNSRWKKVVVRYGIVSMTKSVASCPHNNLDFGFPAPRTYLRARAWAWAQEQDPYEKHETGDNLLDDTAPDLLGLLQITKGILFSTKDTSSASHAPISTLPWILDDRNSPPSSLLVLGPQAFFSGAV